MTTISNIADRIASHAEVLGYATTRSGSSSSGSQYVTVWLADDHGNEIVGDLKIRVSDHDLPGRYEQAHYEIGPTLRGYGMTWAGVVAELARLAGRPVPRAVKAQLTRITRKI